ncbi:MAG: UDP-3-O-[3-hydroxymyristoyl] glucosamine N-acyltransferase [Thiomicrorhabdus sp.]|nr:MAG: UDP-3-O-[3-hydroxymyristoyl] glucosamine N-acyltransferase [Thiomicrorhabdus sp.]
MQLVEIVSHLQGLDIDVKLIGTAEVDIQQVSGLHLASSSHISFLNDRKYIPFLESTSAGAVILSEAHAENCAVTHLVVDNPYYVYALVTQFLNPVAIQYEVHSDSTVDETATLVGQVCIESQVSIHQDVVIGNGSMIRSGAVIEQDVTLGESCHIGSNVVICRGCIVGDNVTIEAGAIIGGDGFGWAAHQGRWEKIPQIGRVVIGNNVSIGNNVCIDRGAIEDTVIEDNCIIDNLVHIAHNVHIGKGSAIAGQVGFAGSTVLGSHCTVAGQVGFAGHLKVVDNSHFFAKAGVTHNINEPGVYSGFPAIPVTEWQKNNVRARGLDKMAKKIKALQKQLDALAANLD